MSMSKRLNKIIYSVLNILKIKIKKALHKEGWVEEVPSILNPKGEYEGLKIGHVALYTRGNAGDILLPRSVRDSIEMENSVMWRGIHAHKKVNDSLITEINKMDRLVIGGGGLFLTDTNPNKMSGWQWSCDIESLKKINTPIILFAVGYNRFRGQKDFSSVFKNHLRILTEKSIYIGLRNKGSILAVKEYLPKELHNKIRFQPCPTTLTKIIYPNICRGLKKNMKENFIALNCAFDRIDLRLGNNKEDILIALALACRELSKLFKIRYYSHSSSDEIMLFYLDRVGVPYELIKLYNIHPKEVIEQYSKPILTIGMRGHAQMIPFGCGTSIISLISHDKLRWFLNDINKPEWGIEMTEPNFKENLLNLSCEIIENSDKIKGEIDVMQSQFLRVTQKNVEDIITGCG